MRNKIKLIATYALCLAIFAAPALVFGQFDPTAGGNTGLTSNSVYNIIQSIMYWILAIVGIVGVIGFAIAGILYLTAAGDEGRIEKAKNAMLYSIIGVIVALAGLVALRFASSMFSGDTRA